MLALGLGAGVAFCADPVVSNLVMTQRTDGSKLVDISYDLFDADDDSMAVVLNLSADGGQTWTFPLLGASGDLGQGIVSGNNKSIIWDCSTYAEGIVVDQFRARVVASDVGVLHDIHSPDNVGILDMSSIDWSDPANIELYSRSDLLMIMAAHTWPNGAFGDISVFDQLRELNPDITIVGYVSVKTAQLSGDTRPEGSYWNVWLERTRDYWAYTTEGDTVQDFTNNVVLNILNPDCRLEMVETIVDLQRASINELDGLYWDYFNRALWIPDFVSVEGDPDLDGDGIPHRSDPDELVAFQAAQVSLVEAVRDSLGEEFVMIFNGLRAYSDSTFASLADGIIYELFPTLFFPEPDMQHALDPNFEMSLFRAHDWLRSDNGGPWMVLTNLWQNYYFDSEYNHIMLNTGNQFRAVAMMVDGYSTWSADASSSFNLRYGWTDNNISLGEALGPPTFEGDFIRRDFQYGKVEIEMTNGDYPNPFNYRIWAMGTLIEMLAIPLHFP